MAQLAKMSTEAFEDFYFEVCNLDYGKMDKAMDSLVTLMNKTDKVRLTGPGTDLTFSIKDIPAIKCSGHLNIPHLVKYTLHQFVILLTVQFLTTHHLLTTVIHLKMYNLSSRTAKSLKQLQTIQNALTKSSIQTKAHATLVSSQSA